MKQQLERTQIYSQSNYILLTDRFTLMGSSKGDLKQFKQQCENSTVNAMRNVKYFNLKSISFEKYQ